MPFKFPGTSKNACFILAGLLKTTGHCEEGEARRGNPHLKEKIATPVCGLVRNDWEVDKHQKNALKQINRGVAF